MSAPPAVRVRELRHSFGKGATAHHALRGVSFEVAAGEIVVLTGASGSGKSSLFSLIGGLRPVQEGELLALGVPLHRSNDADLRHFRMRVRFVFQQFHLLDSLSALENVAVGLTDVGDRRIAAARAEAMLHKVGLSHRGRAFRSELSGGEQQRVAIARALVAEPGLLLADEPTAALDAANGRDVMQLLRQLVREARCTVLIATHDDRVLAVADRHLRIEDGAVREGGTA